MAKKSVGKGKAEEKTMVVCPNCGGREFEMHFSGSLVASNVHPVATRGGETLYQFETSNIGSNYFVEPVFICMNCENEVIL